MRARAGQEQGSTIVVAVMVMLAMMGTGLATFSYVDSQQAQSGRERIRESAFNLAESALDAQVFQLSRLWPSSAAGAYPASCDASSAASAGCPDADGLASSATGADYSSPGCATQPWATSVRDDGGGAQQRYSSQSVDAQPTYDANGNGRLWVRAAGAARCSERTVVTMVELGTVSPNIPRNVLTVNWFETTNNSKKVIIDTQGRAAQPADVVARCNGRPPADCTKFRPGQVAPPTVKQLPATPATALSPVDLAALRTRAVALGTYYPAGQGCPPSLTGPAVYVEDFTGCSGGAANSASAPGVLYIGRGTFSLGGNSVYYGLLYMGNLQGSSGAVVSLAGTAAIEGAVIVDGSGGVSAGASKANIVYAPGAFDVLKVAGTLARTPNTFRELGPGG